VFDKIKSCDYNKLCEIGVITKKTKRNFEIYSSYLDSIQIGETGKNVEYELAEIFCLSPERIHSIIIATRKLLKKLE